MIQATSLRRGTAVLYQGEIHIVQTFKHSTPGNKRGFVQASMKNIKTGKTIQNKFSSTDQLETAFLEPKKVQYLYSDAQGYHFMDLEGYHTIDFSEAMIGHDKYYLKENESYEVLFCDSNPVQLKLAKHVVLEVKEAPPWVKGDSVSNNTKPATLETGLELQVPIFIEPGARIKVDTETDQYVSRE